MYPPPIFNFNLCKTHTYQGRVGSSAGTGREARGERRGERGGGGGEGTETVADA